MMESAIFVTRTSRLHHWNPTYKRLYYGQEFCERLMPSEADLMTVSEFVSLNRVNSFSFVTPFVTEKGYEKLTGLVPLLDKLFPGCEVVVNDWGVFSYFMEHGGHPVVLGRLLTKQKRGPRILNLTDKIPEAALEHFKRAAADSPMMTSFLKHNGVGRVELDNLLFGIKRETQESTGIALLPLRLHQHYQDLPLFVMGEKAPSRNCLLCKGMPGKTGKAYPPLHAGSSDP